PPQVRSRRLKPCVIGDPLLRSAPMAFPRRLLTEGEELVVDARPHWIALVGPVFVTLLILAAEIALFVGVKYVRHHTVPKWIAIGAGLLLFVIYPVRE